MKKSQIRKKIFTKHVFKKGLMTKLYNGLLLIRQHIKQLEMKKRLESNLCKNEIRLNKLIRNERRNKSH